MFIAILVGLILFFCILYLPIGTTLIIAILLLVFGVLCDIYNKLSKKQKKRSKKFKNGLEYYDNKSDWKKLSR